MAVASPQILIADLRRWLARMESQAARRPRCCLSISRRWTRMCRAGGFNLAIFMK